MQTDKITGYTSLGRGGGTLGTAPCGWYVGYFYESPGAGSYYAEDAFNKKVDALAPILNFWTDNSISKSIITMMIFGLAAVLF